jgi:hypothetical protein
MPWRLSGSEPQGWAEVFSLGYPLADRTRSSDREIVVEMTARTLKGYVVRTFENTRHAGFGPQLSYELDMPAPSGMSGAPVLQTGNGSVRLVGVVYGTADSYTIAEQSRVDEASGLRTPEVRRYVTFALAHHLRSVAALSGDATRGQTIAELLDPA